MTYWKITNKEENHYGLQYHDGLMEDTEPFNPSGDCLPGGIYFTDIENIFAFAGFGPWIREVTIPEDAQVYENPGEPKKWKADKVFLHPRREWADMEVFKELVEKGANIHVSDDYLLSKAVANGHLEIVKLLLEKGANVNARNGVVLWSAVVNKRLRIIELLLKNEVNIHAGDNWAFRLAAENGHLEIVKLLLENGADIHAMDDYALFWAKENGHLEIVKLLL